MHQPYPSDWPELPEGLSYKQELSERMSVESEPEYHFRNELGQSFSVRFYEDDRCETSIKYYDSHMNPSTTFQRYFIPASSIYNILPWLLELYSSQYLHTPNKSEVKLRGYDPNRNRVYEYISENSSHSQYTPQDHIRVLSMSECKVTDFPDISAIQSISRTGALLAQTEEVQPTHQLRDFIVRITPPGEVPRTDADPQWGSTIHRYYFEEAALFIEGSDEQLTQYVFPVIDKEMIANTISVKNEEIKHLHPSLRPYIAAETI